MLFRSEVSVNGNATDVQMTVTDDGTRAAVPTNPPGYGLVGMTKPGSTVAVWG